MCFRIVCVALLLMPETLMARTPSGPVIPVEDVARWKVEVYLGASGLNTFVPGPRRGGGTGRPGAMAFDEFGNAYVAAGSIVYAVVDDRSVHLIAGIGLPGNADGPADRAVFNSIRAMILAPDGSLTVGDQGSHTIKRLARGSDGRWFVSTLAGMPGQCGHRDGPAAEALLDRIEGLAYDSRGDLYIMDHEWLMKLSQGIVTTLNPKGGPGFANGPLESARFNQDQGSGMHMLTFDERDTLYVADHWNAVFRKVDLKTGIVSTFAGGPARPEQGFQDTARAMKDGPADQARFHPGGGPAGIWFDRVTGAFYTISADEWAVREIKDGQVRSVGPFGGDDFSGLIEGPVTQIGGHHVALHGVDRQGRLYITDAVHPGFIRRMYRTPPQNAAEPRRPNPLAGDPNRSPSPDAAEGRLALTGGHVEPVAGDAKRLRSGAETIISPGEGNAGRPIVVGGKCGFLVSWCDRSGAVILASIDKEGGIRLAESAQAGDCEQVAGAFADKAGRFILVRQARNPGVVNSGLRCGMVSVPMAANAPTTTVSPAARDSALVRPSHMIQPAVASDGEGFLVAWSELAESPERGPVYALKAQRLDSEGAPIGEILGVAACGQQPAVAFDGEQYVIAYDNGNAVFAQRVSRDGRITGERRKMCGMMERAASIATDGRHVVICAGRIPAPNPWGWHGPAAFFAGRVERDGSAPDQPKVDFVELARGGFYGLLDVAQWKDRPGWPATWRGDFTATRNGYWPRVYSALAWDGKTWVAAFVRSRMEGLALVDDDIFGCRIDPETMMATSEPALLAGGTAEPGSQSTPSIATLDDGTCLLAYQAVDRRGISRVAARFIAGGPLKGPPRTEPVRPGTF